MKVEKWFLNAARSELIAHVAKISDYSSLKILTPKKMFQRLLIAPAQRKAGNASEKLLNKIRQIMYFLCIDQKKNY